VFVVGQISEVDSLASTINLGDVLVYIGSVDPVGTATLGSVVVVSGIQSVGGDLVVADSITALTSSGENGNDGVGNLMSITGSSVSSRTIR
jgi:hypothetical protein